MSASSYRYSTITCDGCGRVHGASGQYETVAAARQGTVADGWTLVPKIRSNGDKAKFVSDVCPSCASTFQPVDLNRGSGSGGGFAISWKRMRELEAEVEALRSKLRNHA